MRRIVAYLMIALVIVGGAYLVIDKIVGNGKKCSVTQSSEGDGYVKVSGDCEVTQTP